MSNRLPARLSLRLPANLTLFNLNRMRRQSGDQPGPLWSQATLPVQQLSSLRTQAILMPNGFTLRRELFRNDRQLGPVVAFLDDRQRIGSVDAFQDGRQLMGPSPPRHPRSRQRRRKRQCRRHGAAARQAQNDTPGLPSWALRRSSKFRRCNADLRCAVAAKIIELHKTQSYIKNR